MNEDASPIVAGKAYCQLCQWRWADIASDSDIIQDQVQKKHHLQNPKCPSVIFLLCYSVSPKVERIFNNYLTPA